MSITCLTADDLIALGVNLWRLQNPDRYSAPEYYQFTHTLVDLLERAEFRNALNLAKPLREEMDLMVSAFKDLQANYQKKHQELAVQAKAIDKIVTGECKFTTLILTDVVPPIQLTKLKNLQPRQQLLLRDLNTCIRSHLARPAIVVGWALGYDIVRWWVFSDKARLADFNAQSKVGNISDYKDFYSIGERQVLDICWKAQGALAEFKEKTHKALVGLLDEAEMCSRMQMTAKLRSIAQESSVEEMVEIVTSPPFEK